MYHKTLESIVLNCGFSFLITHDISEIKGDKMISDILDHPVYMYGFLNDLAQLLLLISIEVPFESFIQITQRSKSWGLDKLSKDNFVV